MLMRPCFGSGNIIADRDICPIRDFWPAVRRATPIGPLLLGGIRRVNLVRIPKVALTSLEIVESERYSLRGFHRGCIAEIRRSGSAIGAIFVSRGWADGGVKAYLSFQEDDESVLKALASKSIRGWGPRANIPHMGIVLWGNRPSK